VGDKRWLYTKIIANQVKMTKLFIDNNTFFYFCQTDLPMALYNAKAVSYFARASRTVKVVLKCRKQEFGFRKNFCPKK
jgi:hypothetical protein